MQPVTVTIDVKPQDIPDLVCQYHLNDQGIRYAEDIACAVAEALDVREFLTQADRVAELRRRLWEQHPSF